MKTICAGIVFVTLFLTLPLKAGILTGPVTNLNNGQVYYLLTATNWNAAEAEAVSLGGHLATIRDAGENQWVSETFATFGGVDRSLWIGLNDVQQEGQFVWISSETRDYFNWNPGEPNDGFSGEDQTLIFPFHSPWFGGWNDAPQSQSHEGVVELNPPLDASAHLSIRVSQVEICWQATENVYYQLQYRTNLDTNAWFNFGNLVVGNGSTICTNDAIVPGPIKRFYRVISSK